MSAEQIGRQVNLGNLVLDDLAIENFNPPSKVVKDFLEARRPAGLRPDFKHHVGNIALTCPFVDKQEEVARGKAIVENACSGSLDVPEKSAGILIRLLKQIRCILEGLFYFIDLIQKDRIFPINP